jgi:5-formaminoimidazole-4-carboxamide-1-beta-D-ribofuranosyl 5'-monophosphate synthetase
MSLNLESLGIKKNITTGIAYKNGLKNITIKDYILGTGTNFQEKVFCIGRI